MNKFLFSIVLLAFSISVNAQSITIHDNNGNVVTNDTVTFLIHPNDALVSHNFSITNETNITMSIHSRRIENNCTENSEEYYCWSICLGAETCGTSFVRDMPYALDILSNTTTTIPLALDFDPSPDDDIEGVEGLATYTYVMYNENNPTDSSYVVVNYNVSIAAKVDEYDNNAISNVFPNPANNMINVQSTVDNARFEIYTLVGTKVNGEQIKTVNGKVSIDVAHLPNGVYMLTELESQITRRFIVSR